MYGVATPKMMAYAREIAKWVSEPLPESFNFVVISAYIDRNKQKYIDARELDNWAHFVSHYNGEYGE
jgi:hypothetical protein